MTAPAKPYSDEEVAAWIHVTEYDDPESVPQRLLATISAGRAEAERLKDRAEAAEAKVAELLGWHEQQRSEKDAKALAFVQEERNRFEQERNDAEARASKMTEALHYYANERHWSGTSFGRTDDFDGTTDALMAKVPGAHARRVLASLAAADALHAALAASSSSEPAEDMKCPLRTFDELEAACRNIGFDLACGACAEVFFTGSGSVPHEQDCRTPSHFQSTATAELHRAWRGLSIRQREEIRGCIKDRMSQWNVGEEDAARVFLLADTACDFAAAPEKKEPTR